METRMNEGDIEKSQQPDPDEVLTAITSFNDPSIITNIFKELNWTYSFEIKEWLAMARQNANLAVKSKALIQLRKLLREAAEAAGYTAKVSQTIPNAQGGQTTFSAKRIAGILNPVKKIESTEVKELQNDKEEARTEPNRGGDRGEGERPKSPGEIHEGISDGTDTFERFPPERGGGRADSDRDVGLGGTEPPDGGETSGRPGVRLTGDNSDSKESNPCIEVRPPTGNKELYPGVSSAGD